MIRVDYVAVGPVAREPPHAPAKMLRGFCFLDRDRFLGMTF